MRKLWLVGTIVLVLLLVVLVIAWRKKPAKTTAAPPPTVAATTTRKHIDPPPAISLQINHANEVMLYRGTPMVLTVSIVNHRAMIADAEEKSDRVYVQQLRTAAGRGEMPKENVEGQIGRMEPAPEVSVIRLGSDAAPWDSSLRLAEKLSDGTVRPLSWATRPVQPAAAKHVTLDATTSAELTFVTDRSVAAQITPGTYQVVAVLDVPSTGNAKTGTWTGQSQSEPVTLAIQEKPPHLSPADEEKLDLHIADFFFTSGDYSESARWAQAALAVNPKSIAAEIALGESEKAQGDLKGALVVFQKATAQFYIQHPKSYEPPTLLLSRVSDIEAQIQGARPPNSTQP